MKFQLEGDIINWLVKSFEGSRLQLQNYLHSIPGASSKYHKQKVLLDEDPFFLLLKDPN